MLPVAPSVVSGCFQARSTSLNARQGFVVAGTALRQVLEEKKLPLEVVYHQC